MTRLRQALAGVRQRNERGPAWGGPKREEMVPGATVLMFAEVPVPGWEAELPITRYYDVTLREVEWRPDGTCAFVGTAVLNSSYGDDGKRRRFYEEEDYVVPIPVDGEYEAVTEDQAGHVANSWLRILP